MHEHGLTPSDYTERPIYQTERSAERQWELYVCVEMIDDMLQMPVDQMYPCSGRAVGGDGVGMAREFSYNDPLHQEDIELMITYERSAFDKSKLYEIAVNTSAEEHVSSAAIGSFYLLHKNGDRITTACLRTIDLENGGMYDERTMTLYDVKCLRDELAKCRQCVSQGLTNE